MYTLLFVKVCLQHLNYLYKKNKCDSEIKMKSHIYGSKASKDTLCYKYFFSRELT